VQPLDFKRKRQLENFETGMVSSPCLPPAADAVSAWHNHPGFALKIPIDQIADHDQVTWNLALSQVLGAELIYGGPCL
jgi:hypothetical protein